MNNLEDLEGEVEEIYQDLRYKGIERTREWIYENISPDELQCVGSWPHFTERALKDALEIKICMVESQLSGKTFDIYMNDIQQYREDFPSLTNEGDDCGIFKPGIYIASLDQSVEKNMEDIRIIKHVMKNYQRLHDAM